MKVQTKQGLSKLLARYQEAEASNEWLNTIKGCIEDNLVMDEVDYENTPKELKPLWKGLK